MTRVFQPYIGPRPFEENDRNIFLDEIMKQMNSFL